MADVKAKQILIDLAGQGMSDAAIAERIQAACGYTYSGETIRRNRVKLKLVKGDAAAPRVDRVDGPALAAPPATIAPQDKADWFRQEFRECHLYPTLQKQFSQDEINTYMEEYGQVCCQFEDLVVSEFFQIDDFLKHRILINRQLIRMKELQAQIEELNAWLHQCPPRDDDTKEIKGQRIERYRLLDGAHASLHKANERYDKLVAERQKIYQNLAATRRDRLDELKGGGDSFFALLANIQSNDRAREQQGQYAELTRLAAKDVAEEFRKTITFPDGSKAPIIMDENAELPPEETEEPEIIEDFEEGDE